MYVGQATLCVPYSPYVFKEIEPQFTIAELCTNEKRIKEVVEHMLKTSGYRVSTDSWDIQYRLKHSINFIVDTDRGKKFLKLHSETNGSNEYNRAFFLEAHLPVVKGECLICKNGLALIVFPFREELSEKSLFDHIWSSEKTISRNTTAVSEMYSSVFSIVSKSLEFSVKSANNDTLYCDRIKTRCSDGISGYVEQTYQNSTMNIANLSIPWSELLDKKWVIDGVEYKETLRVLLNDARKTLNLKNSRWTALCHGDWHEMNICLTKDNSCLFFDFESSGQNEVIGDAMVYLVATALLFDYLFPKYFPNFFRNQSSLDLASGYFSGKYREIVASLHEEKMELSGIRDFGISPIRKQLVINFIEEYFTPLLELCEQKIANTNLEAMVKATLLLRLLGHINISDLHAMDQAKMLGLLLKSIGTPIYENVGQPTLHRFLAVL